MTSRFASVLERSARLGFVAAGFSPAEQPRHYDKFCEWTAAGRCGEMSWLKRSLELRKDPGSLLEGCRTVVCLAYPYPSAAPSTPDGFTAARYSEPEKVDYHFRLKESARGIEQVLKDQFPGSRSRVCVDSAPLLERSFAYRSGLGFIGKNNMLIVPGRGSYVFLVEILTTAFFDAAPAQPLPAGCGTCTRCLDACPTGALDGPHSFDAAKCLSYLTIEYRGKVGAESGAKMGNCFFGCDVCQEICPHNGGKSDAKVSLPSSEEILAMEEPEFTKRFGKTALGRAGLKKIKENIEAIRKGSSDSGE